MASHTERHGQTAPHAAATSGEAALACEMARLRSVYLDLVWDSLVGRLNRDPALQSHIPGYDDAHRLNGWDWPSAAPSMIGHRRMRHLRDE